MKEVGNKIRSIIKKHKSGSPVGITSVCSANEFVIKAAMAHAGKFGGVVLIESTSNQVDQFGGYTRLTPDRFRDYVYSLANSIDFSAENILLGGDHLGPNVWQGKPHVLAMENAREQVRAYVRAGYAKIHLDTSMKCADDGPRGWPLDVSTVAERAAQLCEVAEEEMKNRRAVENELVYVIGTDVPTPGGAEGNRNAFKVTTPVELDATVEITRREFLKYGLDDAWERVIAVVVQPGVEFGDQKIFDYQRSRSYELKKNIEEKENLVFEAHSTDFQKRESLREMVEDHFAILKVGPWLTFAFREALFALEMIEKELLLGNKQAAPSNLSNAVETAMERNPGYWKKYYRGTDEEKTFKRKYSLSDRIRYYWNDTAVKESLATLLGNLATVEVPITLVSQFLPESFDQIRNKEIDNTPESLILNRISHVLQIYDYATSGEN